MLNIINLGGYFRLKESDKNLIAHFNCAHLFQFSDAKDYGRMMSKYKILNVQTQVYFPEMYEKINGWLIWAIDRQ